MMAPSRQSRPHRCEDQLQKDILALETAPEIVADE